MSYQVETLNLGRRPLAGIPSTTEVFDDLGAAVDHHCRVLGDMALRDGMEVSVASRRQEVGEDGIMAAAVLTHATDGGRIEILLRHRPAPTDPA